MRLSCPNYSIFFQRQLLTWKHREIKITETSGKNEEYHML